MLTIRPEQIEALARGAARGFESMMLKHLHDYFPNRCALLEQEELRTAIRYGIERAEFYGMTAVRCVRIYIDTMMMLGGDFDRDVQLPWAGAVLVDQSIPDQFRRADTLYDEAAAYLDEVAGAGRSFSRSAAILACQWMRQYEEGNSSVAQWPIRDALGRVFPAKCSHLGGEAIDRFIVYARERAADAGFSHPEGIALVTMLMFLLGSGLATDPLHPWVHEHFSDTNALAENIRISRLRQNAVNVLEGLTERATVVH